MSFRQGCWVQDTFAGTVGSGALTAHQPDVNLTGNPWSLNGGTPTPTLTGNGVGVASGPGDLQATINTGVADVILGVDHHVGSGMGMGAVVARLTDANNFFVLETYLNAPTSTSARAASLFPLASQPLPAFAPGSTHRLEFRGHGRDHRRLVDGVRQVQVIDTLQQTATSHGIDWNTAYDATSIDDNFEVDLNGAVASPDLLGDHNAATEPDGDQRPERDADGRRHERKPAQLSVVSRRQRNDDDAGFRCDGEQRHNAFVLVASMSHRVRVTDTSSWREFGNRGADGRRGSDAGDHDTAAEPDGYERPERDADGRRHQRNPRQSISGIKALSGTTTTPVSGATATSSQRPHSSHQRTTGSAWTKRIGKRSIRTVALTVGVVPRGRWSRTRSPERSACFYRRSARCESDRQPLVAQWRSSARP